MTSTISRSDHELIKQCLLAAAEGPFFPDWEFDTLIGVSRGDVKALAENWSPDVADTNAMGTAVNVLNNLVGYPHGAEGQLRSRIGVPTEHVQELLGRLVEATNASRT